jgi:hypothetical protein
VVEARSAGPIDLRDATEQTGITFQHMHGGSGTQYIVEAMTAGVATFDYDGDGWLDIYFLNGAPLRGTEVDYTPRNALYRNEGGWRFRDVTQEAGVGDPGFGLGVVAGDYDSDGDADLYVNNYGPNVFFRNNGDGTFTDATAELNLADGNKVGAGASFLDMDADGDLDLYSANYVKFTYESHPHRVIGGLPRAPSPLDFEPETDTLYCNNGDGTFTDVTVESGIARHSGNGMGMAAGDCDNDGDVDVFICNDVRKNFLFQNDGNGHFEEVGSLVGVAYNFRGRANGSMGSDCGDYDNDGWLDFFMTSYQAEMPVLYRNLGNGRFEDVALKAGVGASCQPHVNWGNGFADFDNDGDRDIFVANGHIEELAHLIDDTTAYRVPNAVFLNQGNGKFVDVSASAGSGMSVTASSRGTALDDLDNDGDLDVVVQNAQERPTLLCNQTENGHHWIQFRLIGTGVNREAVGTRVVLTAGDLTQTAEVHSGRGYQSHHGTRLHFGLGRQDRVDRIEIRWLGGDVEVMQDVAADQLLTVIENRKVLTEPRSHGGGR